MHDLVAITPLGGSAPRVDQVGPVTLTEVPDVALASVTARLGHEAATAKLVTDVIGAAAPAPARLVQGALSAFWTGPDQWMIEAPFDSHEDLAQRITAQAKRAASVTEQTDAWCRFDLTGPRLADVLERLCNVNLRGFTGGEAQRTTLEHLGCFLLCRAPDHVSILGPRSSAGSLHHALMTAMHSAL